MTLRVVRLASEDDFDGWRAAARTLVAEQVPADQVLWQVGTDAVDLFAGDTVLPACAPALTVHKDFVSLARRVILHNDPHRFSRLYALLLRVIHQPQVLWDQADPQRRQIEVYCDTIRRDIHKMRAFVRFREIETDSQRRFVAWFEPEHHIIRANARFFVDRFTTMHWSILTPALSVHWDGETLTEGPGASRKDAAADDPVEDIWKGYFTAIFNPARLNPGAMMKEMPKKYWKNMPEAALIPDLIATARAREVAMIDASRAGEGVVRNGPDDVRRG